MDMLTVKQVAELKGCTIRYVRQLIADGYIAAQEADMPGNNQREYRIPISSLEPKLQQKYYHQLSKQLELVAPVIREGSALDEYTEQDRAAIRFWSQLLKEWQTYRNNPAVDNKVEVDNQFIAMLKLRDGVEVSTGTLYRKWRAYRENDLDGLVDKRGEWKRGKYSLPNRLYEIFLTAYMDERHPPITQCVEDVVFWTEKYKPEWIPELPSREAMYHSFRRWLLKEVPKAVTELGRNGAKTYEDRCAPFVIRLYGDIESNQYWIADNHTFDFIAQDENGNQRRLYLTAFIDARSTAAVGWFVTDTPSSQATLMALRHGILRCGVPQNIYCDNGREFLNVDIGGLGHRQKKSTKNADLPPPIFERLNIGMVNALVLNAKAKPIERTFGNFKNIISRNISTFTGGNVLEKPSNLKQRLKEGIPYDKEIREYVDILIDGIYNQQPYTGEVTADHGKTRIEVYNEHLYTKRVATAEDLTLLLMRSTRPQTVGRNGVYITINEERIYFWNEWTHWHQGEKVYVRYDPADLQEVRIYDAEDDRFLATAPLHKDFMLKFGGATKEEIATAQRRSRQVRRATQMLLEQMKNESPNERIDKLCARIEKGKRAMETMAISGGEVLQIVPVSSKEKPSHLQAANGGEVVAIDQATLNRKALYRQYGINYKEE